MIAITIFWAAALCSVFWVLGIILKGLYAAIISLLETGMRGLGYSIIAGLVIALLYIAYGVADSFIMGKPNPLMYTVALYVLVCVVGFSLVGWFWTPFVWVIYYTIEYSLKAIIWILEVLSTRCVLGYNYFLRVIVDKTQKL